jgi:hypothetical protein
MDKYKRTEFGASLVLAVSIAVLVIALSSLVAYIELYRASSQDTGTAYLSFQISVNYSGPWNLVYWKPDNFLYSKADNSLIPQNNFNGTIRVSGDFTTTATISGTDYVEVGGSGFYSTTVQLSGEGPVHNGVVYIEETLCGNATKLDSQNLTLTLTIFQNKSTTAADPSVEVCGTEAV